MRIENEEHGRHDWWVERYARECGVENLALLDLWQYPIEADSADDFETFSKVHDMGAMVAETSVVVRALFGLRVALGKLLRWDGQGGSDAHRAHGSHADEGRNLAGFEPIYRDSRELVMRTENATVVALMHLGWVPLANGKWTAQLAVYAAPQGWLGRTYMAAIGPFRHRLVYPGLMRAARRRWQRQQEPERG